MADIQFYDFNGTESNIIEVIEQLYLLKDSNPALIKDLYDTMGVEKIAQAAEHLEKSELYLLDLRNSLDKAAGYLNEINALSAIFPKLHEKLQKQVPKKIAALATYIERIFEESVYNSMNFMDTWWSPLENFNVFAGQHMDQFERFKFSRHFISPKMSLEDLQIRLFFEVEDPVVWSTICREANKRIALEKLQINAYLKRIIYFKRFFYIEETFTELEDQLVTKPVADIQKQLLLKTGAYLDLSEDLLKDIKSKAEQRLTELEQDTNSSPDKLLLETEALVDEINRMASHAQFNGMTLLTGRWVQGAALSENISFQIPTMTVHSFITVPRGLPWYDYENILEDYSNAEGTKVLISQLEKAIQKVQESAASLEEAQKQLPAASNYHPVPFEEDVRGIIDGFGLDDEAYTLFLDDLPDNNTFTIAAMHSAENGVRTALDLLRKIHNRVLQGGNTIYNWEEKNKLWEQIVSLTDKLQQIAMETGINGSALLSAGESLFRYWIDGPEQIKGDLILSGIDPESLEFREGSYSRGLSIQEEMEANYGIMLVDQARRQLSNLGRQIHFQKILAYITAEYQKHFTQIETTLENGADNNLLASQITGLLSVIEKTARRIDIMDDFITSPGVHYWTKEIIQMHIQFLNTEISRPLRFLKNRIKQQEERSGTAIVFGEMILTETLESIEKSMPDTTQILLGLSQIRETLHPFAKEAAEINPPQDYLDQLVELYGDEGSSLKTLMTLEDILENLSKAAKDAFVYLDKNRRAPEQGVDIEDFNRFIGEKTSYMQELLNAAEFDGSFIFQGGSASINITDSRVMNLSFRNIRFSTVATVSSEEDIEQVYDFFKTLRGALLQNRELIRFYIDAYKTSILVSRLKGLNSLEDCKAQIASLEISLVKRVRRYIQLALNDGSSSEFKKLYTELGTVLYQEAEYAYKSSIFNGERVFSDDEIVFPQFPVTVNWFDIRRSISFLDGLKGLNRKFQDVLRTNQNR